MPRVGTDSSRSSPRAKSSTVQQDGDSADTTGEDTLNTAITAPGSGEDDDGEEEEEDVIIRSKPRNVRVILDDGAPAGKSKTDKATHLLASKTTPAVTSSSFEDEDEEGNGKIYEDGALLPGRQYTSRAFRLPTRGDDYWFLATEIARVTGYRDSYLFFNKNKHLTKFITTDAEKSYLIAQELIPYSYRNRPIGIVSARKCFKTFGSKIIVRGKRVRDDYFAQRAREQGFTDEVFANKEDKPAPDRSSTNDATHKREQTLEGSRKKAKPIADYNAALNAERRERMQGRLKHFHFDRESF
ncbi:chromatin remodelling complex Rsc7/Swp82 subunit-domain-containing protein [Protomyces lactucae-debilis]|uniref:Chromatin remodelling complex Rsc7/Swp82 subunit-domain-containing protein n=1 Tax=Protomyces lactucae-debilis TaxID=2754530 RepID=A0A1Y2FT28_PROLT|nr:chromatin remodelling complex Rsc7/Swp82 subunit-domain-containing protein [Protomyces lactucae-debilis]ORY87160.1 chromatin remodelling complex Rsc7/Swp82 subunit-domain-containing protein [Protomyces lactucae-debilis]